MNSNFLTLVLFLPLIFGFAILALPRDNKKLHGQVALAGSIVTLLASLLLFVNYGQHSVNAFPISVSVPWIAPLNIGYHVGIDGISLLMVLMTTIIFPFIVAVSFEPIQDRTNMYYFLIMAVETAILGTFVSLDLVLFYIFYEAMLIPIYFIIGIWGGPKRVFATLKFFLYTMAGSMLMLVSILSIFFMVHSFDLPYIQAVLLPTLSQKFGTHAGTVEMLLFLGFFAAFAVKAPLFPFHTWVPDAYAEAPIAGSILLVALKMGLYGLIRFNVQLFPNATHVAGPIIEIFAVIGVVYAALIAAMQTDLKRLIAYSSISHIGVIVIAIFSLTTASINGAVIQMVSHTITTGALFILVGALFARRGTYDINAFGGVMRVMPVFSSLFLIATLSSVALPGTSGFQGEFLILVGSFARYPWITGIATTAAIWSAVYMLWMYQRVMHGKVTNPEVGKMYDLSMEERWGLIAPLVVLIFWIGIYPKMFIDKLDGPVGNILQAASTPDVDATPMPSTPTGQTAEADPYRSLILR